MSLRSFLALRVWILIATAIIVVAYIWSHEPPSALPEEISGDVKPFENAGFAIAAAESIQNIVNLVTALSFGLFAIVGFALRNGLGQSRPLQLVNASAVGLFIYFSTRVFVLGYDCYAAVAVQLDRGYFFLTRFEDLVGLQVRSLAGSAFIALLILFVNLACAQCDASESEEAPT